MLFFAGALLLQSQQLAAMNKAPMRDQKSIQNYMENHASLVEEEASFVYDTEDLVTLRPGRDCSIVDAIVEKSLRVCDCKALQVSCWTTVFVLFPHQIDLCFFNYSYLSNQVKY